jgi:hypothetical protein
MEKEVTMKKKKFLMVFVLVFICLSYSYSFGKTKTCKMQSFYCNSLHYFSEGMRYHYEAKNGAIRIIGKPYSQLDCKKCHAKSCDVCHAKKVKGKMVFSTSQAKNQKTCFKCHGRENKTLVMEVKNKVKDAHEIGSKMFCTDCHGPTDIMGDGKSYKTMRDPGAVSTTCIGCHKKGAKANLGKFKEIKPYTIEIRDHRIHRGKLDCVACHVTAVTNCYNCHFGETRSRNVSIPHKTWALLVNYGDKVTTGSVMTIVYKKKKFIVYAPRMDHSIGKKAKTCKDCHNNKSMQYLKANKKIPMTLFKNNKLITWNGIAPAVKGKLYWVFLEKDKNGNWYKLPDSTPVVEQWGLYAKPLTEEQLKKLTVPFK